MGHETAEGEASAPLGRHTDDEVRELMGMFDVPSFARRGHALEFALARFHDRCRASRSEMLDMVRTRLGQWGRVAKDPADWRGVFAGPISDLWTLSAAEDPTWSESCHPIRRRREIARGLLASINRFNARWTRHVIELDLAPINRMIHQYNQFYLMEKECVLGSARLAARFFRPETLLSAELLLRTHPILPAPVLA
jgi:hypothetical protein